MTAAIAAYQKGGPWLDALRSYLYENKQTARTFLETQLPKLHLVPSEATYLLWIDCKELTEHAKELGRFLREKPGCIFRKGSQYGKTGETFLRMNIACRRACWKMGWSV